MLRLVFILSYIFNTLSYPRAWQYTRACFKIAFWQMYVTVCGRFVPDEGRVAGYVT
ncbi:DUF6783 domain-containing protein [uncultured Robinsoniella sp.]|uniref:DUF6783 domain-containing protein n=1 Tax=uncultured Robinsoniella sp. TaxID=904190 RepID=UPI00374F3E59